MALVLRIIGHGERDDDPSRPCPPPRSPRVAPPALRAVLTGEKTADDVIEALEAVDAYRWQTTRGTSQMEVGLLELKLDRRAALRQRRKAYRSGPPKGSQHSQQQTAGVKRSGKIVDELSRRRQSPDRTYGRMNAWRRTLRILELGLQFQVLDEIPR